MGRLILWTGPSAVHVPGTMGSMSETREIEHEFGRPAQPHTFRRHDNGPVDQDRMLKHEVDQLVVAPLGIGKAQLGIGRALRLAPWPLKTVHG